MIFNSVLVLREVRENSWNLANLFTSLLSSFLLSFRACTLCISGYGKRSSLPYLRSTITPPTSMDRPRQRPPLSSARPRTFTVSPQASICTSPSELTFCCRTLVRHPFRRQRYLQSLQTGKDNRTCWHPYLNFFEKITNKWRFMYCNR